MVETKVITVESIGLPSAKSKTSDAWVDQKFLIYGQTKIGKTKFWAQGDRNFFLKTEQGHNHVEVIGLPIRSYKEFSEAMDKLVMARKIEPYPYDTVVVDTFDRLIEYIEEDVIEWARNKFKSVEVNSISDVPNGAGWSERSSRLNSVLRRFDELPCAKAIVMHTMIDELEDERGKYKRETVNIGGKSNRALTGWADHTMAVRSAYVGDQLLRRVELRPTRNLDAGSRGVLPEKIAWIGDDKLNYENFRKMFK